MKKFGPICGRLPLTPAMTRLLRRAVADGRVHVQRNSRLWTTAIALERRELLVDDGARVHRGRVLDRTVVFLPAPGVESPPYTADELRSRDAAIANQTNPENGAA